MAMLKHADKVTSAPATCTEADVVELRDCGWTDDAIHDAVQVVSYFNYINRIADALGCAAGAGVSQLGRCLICRIAGTPVQV